MHDVFEKNIQYIKGVGPKKAKAFERLGVTTLWDLLNYVPIRYEDRTKIYDLENAPEEENVSLVLQVIDKRLVRARRFRIVKLRVSDGIKRADVLFFNQDWLNKYFKIGKKYYFYGKVKRDILNIELNNPEYSDYSEDIDLTGIFPVYNLTRGITSKTIRNIMDNAIKEVEKISLEEVIPESFIKSFKIKGIIESLIGIHKPEDFDHLKICFDSMKKREIFFLQFAFRYIKGKYSKLPHCLLKEELTLKEYQDLYPFDFTNDQKKVIKKINKEIFQGRNVNILLQGDVGSGKTVVATYYAMLAVKNGQHGIIMAPTEVLATQHFNNIRPIAEKLNIEVVLLKGGTSKKKKETLSLLADERPLLIIGTHALFQSKAKYSRTGFVIIDEQHRFGVEQRNTLIEKTGCHNIIVMSATPIPRSLALSAYGDMDYAIINEKPAMRKSIKTYLRDDRSLKKIYEFVKSRIVEGEKCFIITPLVEESEKMDLRAATEVYERAKSFFGEEKVLLLHGRMKEKEKDSIMKEFSSEKGAVLVSTTVVEVGVDIPEATVMIIKNAERFGIAQLHQLRGRVGRGDLQSYCILVHSDNLSKTGQLRLRALESSDDGFVLADEDLKQRGAGDVFGSRQHGFGTFIYTRIPADKDIIEKIKESVDAYFKIIDLVNIDEKLLCFTKKMIIGKHGVL